MKNDYLPMNRNDMSIRGWKQCDFVYVSGDAYVDHPSFGTAIISRLLEAHGYKVGIIAQPDWKDKRSIEVLGRPRLGFLVSAGDTGCTGDTSFPCQEAPEGGLLYTGRRHGKTA